MAQGPNPTPSPGPPASHEALSFKTNDPTLYWRGLPITVRPFGPSPPIHGVLLAASRSMSGHGLFFDPMGWLAIAAGVLVISALWWWPLIRSITRPLAGITQATEKLAQGNFDVKLDSQRGDELGRLAGSINHMAARLKDLIWGHKRFLGHVAHELTSPLARINLGLGVLEQELGEKHKARLQAVIEDGEHMSRLLDEMLSFSRAEINPQQAQLQTVELAPLAERAVAREVRPPHELVLSAPPGLMVTADPELLVRALCNLLRNAVRYAAFAGPMEVRAKQENGLVEIEVRDSGPGVAPAQLPKLFEPFYRNPESGDRSQGGVGLGLSMVKTCIEACRGSVSCRNLQPQGFAVTITLPAGTKA